MRNETKIAIVCDWLTTLGGAEKVLSELIHTFPHADLFAVVDFLPKTARHILQGKTVQTTFIQNIPFAKKHYRYLLPLMPLAIEQLDLSAYQVILSSSHAVAKGILTGPDQLHISYVHTPMRYVWDLQHTYLRETGLDNKWHGAIARYFLHKLRAWDLHSAHRTDHFIANSNFIARRIQKTYRRDATVIYPPVDLTKFSPLELKFGDFYLTAARFVPYKKLDLIVESFWHMPNKKLMVIGDGPDFLKVKAKASQNVTFLGHQPDAVLINHLQQAKAFIFAAEEDFGLLPVEAQACGTPVIAFGKGGARETVHDLSSEKPTGVLFHEQTTEALIEAVQTFEANASLIKKAHCVENAARFSHTHFRSQIQAFVNEQLLAAR